MPGRLALVVASMLAAAPAAGAGFDCARAASAVEKAVCADATLSELDEHLGRYYAAARVALKDGAACLQPDQQRWLRRRDACGDAACLKGAYLDRLAELDALQPGATAVKNIALPDRPALAWVVPPAADKVAAPDNPKARAVELTGTLLDEVATGDGYVLRTVDGARHLLVQLMFLDGNTATRLSQLAREPQASFTVRGHVARDRGRSFFEPSRCAFIHRVAAAPGQVFPDPSQPRPGFKAHELAFATPADGVARAEFRSAPFFAVILRTAERCSVTEAERRQVQALFPANKVFSTRFDCPESAEEHVTYTNVDPKWGFLAVYAGSTRADAERFLKGVAATGRFPGANVREMQAVLVYP